MSTSTNAYLFYGICWDKEDHVWPWSPRWYGEDEENALPEDQRAGEEETDDDWLKRICPILAAELTIGEHCMRTCPMGFVAISHTYEHAWRGYPKKLNLSGSLTDDAEREWEEDCRRTLRNFCELVGYDFDQLDREQKVGWFLCSWWEE